MKLQLFTFLCRYIFLLLLPLRRCSTQSVLEVIDRKTALLLPAILGGVDIIKVFQLKPGGKNSGEGISGISVRGDGTDQSLVSV